MLDFRHRLRLAALVHLAAALPAGCPLLPAFPRRFPAAPPPRPRVRHFLGAQPLRRMLLGKQKARLQICEPGCHHQIIGGQLQAHFARVFDKGEILIRQRQNGDLGEIDFLLSREREQQVERALEPLNINHERGLVAGSPRQFGFEFVLGVHAEPAAGSMPCISLLNWARAAPVSRAAGVLRAVNAACARRAASPSRSGAAAATSRISAVTPLQWSTMSQPAAITALVRSPSEPDKAPIEMSSLISRPINPIESRITLATILAEVVAGATGSMAVNTTWAVMPNGRARSGRKAAKSVVSSAARSVVTTGRPWWLSAVARP